MKHTTNFNGHSGTMTRIDLKEKRKFSFFATALLKRKKDKKEMPSLNFLSRFLSSASFSSFAVYFLLCIEKITHNKKLATPPTAKELNPSRKTKTGAKKFCLPAGASLTALYLSTILFSIDSFAQINTEPVMPTFQPVPIGHSYTPGNLFPDQWDYFPQLKNPLQSMREQQQIQTQQQNRQLWMIEKTFRISKTDLRIRPIYHRLQRRIEAHICIAFTACKIYKELERQLYEMKSTLSPEKAINILKTIYKITIQTPYSNT